MVGVHTPELSSEHGISNVRADAKKRGLQFPIVVDDAEANWNAWGNSMWPAVYLIDKQGIIQFIQKGVPSNADFLEQLKMLQ